MERQKSSTEKILNYLVKNGAMALQIGRRFIFDTHGLSEPKFEILQLLAESKNALGLSELSEHLGVSNANITGLIDRLERDSLVVRQRALQDRRVTLAAITPQGLHLYRQVLPCYTDTIEDLFGKIPQSEQDLFVQMLQKLHLHLQFLSTSPKETVVK